MIEEEPSVNKMLADIIKLVIEKVASSQWPDETKRQVQEHLGSKEYFEGMLLKLGDKMLQAKKIDPNVLAQHFFEGIENNLDSIKQREKDWRFIPARITKTTQ